MLPTELLHEIVGYLEWPFDLPPVRLASRQLGSCATIAMARTLCIPFEKAEQDAMLAWLKLLCGPAAHHLRAAVERVVLDDIVKPLYPTVPDDVLDGRRRWYVDEELPLTRAPTPHKAFYAFVKRLVPRLDNVMRVDVRRPLSWFLLATASDGPGSGSGSADGEPQTLGRLFQKIKLRKKSLSVDGELGEVGPGGPWQLLLNKPRLRELFVTCMPGETPTRRLLDNVALTTLALHDLDCRMTLQQNDIFTAPGGRSRPTTPWTPVLAACRRTLRHLGLVRVLGFAALIAYIAPPPQDAAISDASTADNSQASLIQFDKLESFEAYKLALRGEDSQALATFLEYHSSTLQVLAMGVRCDLGGAILINPQHDAGHFVRSSWLDEPDILRNLRVLRLENADFVRNWTTPLAHQMTGELVELRRETARKLATWALERPSLCDVSFPDLFEDSVAVDFRRQVSARAGGRGESLVGIDRLTSFNSNVVLSSPLPPASPSDTSPVNGNLGKKYLWSAWVFYTLLFDGLMLERSGFRPYLPLKSRQEEFRKNMELPTVAYDYQQRRIPVRTGRRLTNRM